MEETDLPNEQNDSKEEINDINTDVAVLEKTEPLEEVVISKENSKDFLNTSEHIYSIIEEAFPKQDQIRQYALPQALQWVGTRFFALWVYPILAINNIRRFFRNLDIVKPYKEHNKDDEYLVKGTETIYTATNRIFNGKEEMRFFGGRFIAIWVFPMAITGIVMEFLFVSPLKGVNPFG